jgi:hypothetical protein
MDGPRRLLPAVELFEDRIVPAQGVYGHVLLTTPVQGGGVTVGRLSTPLAEHDGPFVGVGPGGVSGPANGSEVPVAGPYPVRLGERTGDRENPVFTILPVLWDGAVNVRRSESLREQAAGEVTSLVRSFDGPGGKSLDVPLGLGTLSPVSFALAGLPLFLVSYLPPTVAHTHAEHNLLAAPGGRTVMLPPSGLADVGVVGMPDVTASGARVVVYPPSPPAVEGTAAAGAASQVTAESVTSGEPEIDHPPARPPEPAAPAWDFAPLVVDLPAGLPLAGVLGIDLAAVQDGVREALGQVAALGVMPDEGWGADVWLAAAAVLTGAAGGGVWTGARATRRRPALPPGAILGWGVRDDGRLG